MSDPHVLAPGTAPTPFTADEIRRATPHGRTITLLVEPAEGPSWRRVNRFVDPDDEGATLQRWRIGPDGDPTGDVETEVTTWLRLQGHSSFPVSVVTITPDTVELPFGTVEALRYTVDDGGDGATTFWFAPTIPGMPVRYETPAQGGGTDRTTMISNELT